MSGRAKGLGTFSGETRKISDRLLCKFSLLSDEVADIRQASLGHCELLAE